jgi:tRNA dimethylallyltransferase
MARLRRPTLLVGLTIDRDELARRIDARVEEMIDAGAAREARTAKEHGASRTALAALGFEELLEGDIDAVKGAHRAYARRQLTWMRRMEGVELVDRTGRDDGDVAQEIVATLGENGA